jgi:hypothetical protein
MERDILKNCGHLLGATEMRFRFIEDHRDTWPVRVLCAALKVSASGYTRGGFDRGKCQGGGELGSAG